jgi:cytochrome c biogenesis protein CcmG/thiol:disulfide interchange protein DsbE
MAPDCPIVDRRTRPHFRSPHRRPRARIRDWSIAALVVCCVAISLTLVLPSSHRQSADLSVQATDYRVTTVSNSLVGKFVPPILGTDVISGKHVSLFSMQGHYVFLTLFGSWCPPCRAEIAQLESLNHSLSSGAHRAELISLDVDDQAASAKQFIRSQNIRWPVVDDPRGVIANSFGATGAPITFLISPTGRLAAEPIQGPATKAQLEQLLRHAQHLAR